MIESPKNFIEQFQNFIEHIAEVMKTFLTKKVADTYYLNITEQTLTSEQKSQIWTNIGLQNASTSTGGVILITTQEKITTGTDDVSAVTPLSLNSNAVLYSKAQTLTDEQKQQARDNIGAMSVDAATTAQILQAFQDFANEHGIVVPETTNTEG